MMPFDGPRRLCSERRQQSSTGAKPEPQRRRRAPRRILASLTESEPAPIFVDFTNAGAGPPQSRKRPQNPRNPRQDRKTAFSGSGRAQRSAHARTRQRRARSDREGGPIRTADDSISNRRLARGSFLYASAHPPQICSPSPRRDSTAAGADRSRSDESACESSPRRKESGPDRRAGRFCRCATVSTIHSGPLCVRHRAETRRAMEASAARTPLDFVRRLPTLRQLRRGSAWPTIRVIEAKSALTLRSSLSTPA